MPIIPRQETLESARRMRGVYPTPRPLIGYVVRSVHALLRSKLGLAAGLADPGVRLLDPAAGTMRFLRAAWRQAIAAHGGADRDLIRHLLAHFSGIEVRPEAHARGLTDMRRFLRAAGCGVPPERLPAILGDALAPAPELLGPPFNVVLGNPPWCGRSSNQGRWMAGLLREYFQVDGESLGERNPKWLNDDYVKFLRLAQWLIERNGKGIVAFVLNHNFLDAPTFRGLRRSLLRTFHEIYALDLHGNRRRRESDDNVFPGVAQGAALLLLVRKPGLRRRVLRADLQGSRGDKLRALGCSDCSTTAWTEIEPEPQGSLFVRGDRAVEKEYRRGLPLPEIFPVHGTGIVTGRDAIVTALDRDTLRARFAPALAQNIAVFLARPFDLRSVLYAEGALARPRRALMSHLLGGANVGLVACRQCKGEPGALVTRWLVGHKALCPHDVSSLFPLYLEDAGGGQRPNLARGLGERLGGWYGAEPEPEAILGYVYAVLLSDIYRQRYRELLRRSFPRISFSPDRQQFAALSALGRELIGLHLLQDPRLRQATVCAGKGSAACEGVEPEVWEYRVGSYCVLRQWLRARRGRDLSAAEARHFCSIVEALRLTRDVQRRIQEVMCD